MVASARALGALVLAVAVSCVSTGRPRPLFNGRDLSGWVNVNGAADTWQVRDGMIYTTGLPIGFMRTARPYRNFVLDVEWRHEPRSDGREGNAGIFIWADSMAAPESRQFPRGVEVQVLVGLEWRDSTGALTATSHGDVFAIWGAKCTPDQPHPRGWMRSIPKELRAKGFGEWNHYRITAVDGVVSLAVNGKEVSQLHDCSPSSGYIALESEGNPVYFRNLRITELP